MADFIAQFGGIGLAFLGAALAVGLCCVGLARGTGMVGEAATGVLSETLSTFPMPDSSSSARYSGPVWFGIWFFALFTMGAFGGITDLSVTDGLTIFCFPVSPWPRRLALRALSGPWPQPPSMWLPKSRTTGRRELFYAVSWSFTPSCPCWPLYCC